MSVTGEIIKVIRDKKSRPFRWTTWDPGGPVSIRGKELWLLSGSGVLWHIVLRYPQWLIPGNRVTIRNRDIQQSRIVEQKLMFKLQDDSV